ncbi:fungal-specific transcription factor domain-containing protein [Armillaria novae-zelandiae]|uniref:Fungal-specific transcription factor domain-containing protein n=1 Tax=Armillaria novae-zelandiae TaxID=153914 RepID=A0AA39UFM1_9AGAR|nr:fungal-specific transcription factor domain-containing protein [Armillaria novae-zelandiae]
MPVAKNGIKKHGAPKSKGSVRAKSGCYTCRIRRKKCDEDRDEHGNCKSCVRLKLQCLGFGPKRPEWLKEQHAKLRADIKNFLAGNGMIKGHASTNTRDSNPDQILLLRQEDDSMSSSESPESRNVDLPITGGEYSRNTSAMRDEPWTGVSSTYVDAAYPGDALELQLRQDSPYDNDGAPYDIIHYPNSPPGWSGPSMRSSISPSYNFSFTVPDDPPFESTMPYYTTPLLPGGSADELVNHYLNVVLAIQFQLADETRLPQVIYNAVEGDCYRNAARLLALIHQQRDMPTVFALQDITTMHQYDELKRALSRCQEYTEDEAMASLTVISSFLFDGGKGEWQLWLEVAFQYAKVILGRYTSPRAALMSCTEKERFLVKTAIWFDVLASVTTRNPPLFLETIRELFAPDASGITELYESVPAELSMMTVMGCETRIVWALAETSYLASWKQRQLDRGALSVPSLFMRSQPIDLCLSEPIQFPRNESSSDEARNLSSEIFRTSARVYLRAVVSGDHPSVADIATSVQDALSILGDLNHRCTARVRTAVIRSTVFAFFVCGCLTDNPSHRHTLRTLLAGEGSVGNCSALVQLLDKVWNIRSRLSRHEPVPWRQILNEEKMLLV